MENHQKNGAIALTKRMPSRWFALTPSIPHPTTPANLARRWLQTALLLLPLTIHAAPMAVTTTAEGATITIYTEPCALEAVANLDRRATWDEKGVRHEGCAGVTSGVVAFYFEDRTVVLAPVSAFRRADGI